MMQFTLKTKFDVSSKTLYNAWLNSKGHENMTGGGASIKPAISSSFTAWDGYISGRILDLIEDKKIVQSWRTSEFKSDDSDSLLEIHLEDENEGCLLTLFHSKIPDNQPDYKKGWEEHYFKPMQKHFNQQQ